MRTAESLATEPPVLKKTRFRSPGASSASFAASSVARRIPDIGEVRILREQAELPGCRIDQLLPAESDVGEPQSADSVDELLALGVPDVGAFAPHHDGGTSSRPVGEVRPWMNAVIEIGLPQGLGIVVPEHSFHLLPRASRRGQIAAHRRCAHSPARNTPAESSHAMHGTRPVSQGMLFATLRAVEAARNCHPADTRAGDSTGDACRHSDPPTGCARLGRMITAN